MQEQKKPGLKKTPRQKYGIVHKIEKAGNPDEKNVFESY
jgi:hypothetical protein